VTEISENNYCFFWESNEFHKFTVRKYLLQYALHLYKDSSASTYVSMRVRPPSLCINSTLTPAKFSLKPLAKPLTYLCMCGVRYASAHAVNPRGTMRTIGITWCDKDTWSNPRCLAMRPTASSCSGYLATTQKQQAEKFNKCNKDMMYQNIWLIWFHKALFTNHH